MHGLPCQKIFADNAKKWVGYPILAMSAYGNAMAKSQCKQTINPAPTSSLIANTQYKQTLNPAPTSSPQ